MPPTHQIRCNWAETDGIPGDSSSCHPSISLTLAITLSILNQPCLFPLDLQPNGNRHRRAPYSGSSGDLCVLPFLISSRIFSLVSLCINKNSPLSKSECCVRGEITLLSTRNFPIAPFPLESFPPHCFARRLWGVHLIDLSVLYLCRVCWTNTCTTWNSWERLKLLIPNRRARIPLALLVINLPRRKEADGERARKKWRWNMFENLMAPKIDILGRSAFYLLFFAQLNTYWFISFIETHTFITSESKRRPPTQFSRSALLCSGGI